MEKYHDIMTELREDRKKSQSEVALIIGTSQQYYGQYELGKRQLTFDRAILLAKYYNVSLDYLAGLIDKERKLT